MREAKDQLCQQVGRIVELRWAQWADKAVVA
jgi:hypothetical protein